MENRTPRGISLPPDMLDGEVIARKRIAREATERTGFLDLGRLALPALPEELFALKHLRRLNLGFGIVDEDAQWVKSNTDIAANNVDLSLDRLHELPELEVLSLSGCRLFSLGGIAGLTALRRLDCSSTQVSNLDPLTGLTELQTLRCSSTQVRHLAPLVELTALQTLDCSDTKVSDLQPLARLAKLQMLGCRGTKVSDLAPLAELTALQVLDCSGTQVSDLQPLLGLTVLQWLECFYTKVHDLRPLSRLTVLQSLNCFMTQVRDLEPLAELTALQMFSCSSTQVNNLNPLAGLIALQTLYCSNTQINNLEPLAGLTALQELNCSSTQVRDLQPLAKLSTLQTLYCSSTYVSNLRPLTGLAKLQTLYCSGTQVRDLDPLAELTALQTLDCSWCSLTHFPQGLLHKLSLKKLILYDCRLPSVPAAVLSQCSGENCLEALRAHVRDLENGEVVARNVKLMVLGNGRVGKTQLCRRLRGEQYDESVASTHGIIVTTAPLPASDDGPPARLHIWDFGGQDIYHGTHALFMRTNAIFLLAWTPALENARKYKHEGIIFRNHPLAYWVDYVRHLGGRGSPVLVVQTRCDRPQDDEACQVSEANLFAAFDFRQTLRYSARTNRGRAALDEALVEATACLRDREGIAVIGLGRHRVQQRLEEMRDADAALAPEARQYRTITQAQFRRLCDEVGGISSPDHLLSYLDNTGIVIYLPGLFDDAIILDQNWALEAIYAVFHRGKSYTKIRWQLGGRFTRSNLEDWVWQDHSVEEQKLFLSMMQSCGICFEHRRIGPDDEGEIEYIAPDLLPDRAEVEVRLEWDADLPAEVAAFEYPLLHPGLMCSVISRIGAQAGLAAEYWQGGVYVYEKQTKSRGLIEQEMIEGWRGRIRVQTQSGQAVELLERLMALVKQEQSRWGMTPSAVTTTAAMRTERMALGEMPAAEPSQEITKMEFAQEPSFAPEWCVSYAWGDDTPEGQEREAIVDRLCVEAVAQGKQILRDKKDMGLGEQILKFMRRIGQADRVFVVLSDKYLKSPFCMFELSEVWRTSRQEDEEFLRRIRVYTLPCAKIWTPKDRARYSIHWKQQHDDLEALVKEHGYDILGERDAQQLRRMRDFSRNVGDILATAADILQPRSFDELVKYGWQD